MRNSLLVFRGFAHDSQSVLAAIERLALVGIKGCLEFSFRTIFSGLIGVELRTATLTDPKSTRGAFYDPKMAFRHDPSLAQCQERLKPCGFQTTPLPDVCLLPLLALLRKRVNHHFGVVRSKVVLGYPGLELKIQSEE